MTEQMSQDRLQLIAEITAQPNLPPRRLVPILSWDIDAGTRRPVGRWILSEKAGQAEHECHTYARAD